ncbi:MAG: O-antigen ligase family protein [Candidatus Omnitrophota bacterium]|nr:O-antigen ligase family protein [Candidatus Omnitrophota bacterium]
MAIVREWVSWLTVLALSVMIFTLPFSKSAVEICIAVAFALWILNRALSYDSRSSLIRIFKPVDTKLNLPVYLFIIAAFLSVLLSTSISLSLRGFFSKLLKGVVLYFIVAEIINDRKKLNAVMVTMVLSMLLIGADGIFQYVTTVGDFLRKYPQAGRITASFSSANGFGAWLIVMLPLLYGIFYALIINKPKKAIPVILWFLAGVLIICLSSALMACLVLTRSRGAWTGLAFAAIFFMIVNMVVKKNRIFLISIVFILLASLIAIPFFIHMTIEGQDPVFAIKQSLVLIMQNMDIVRTNLWREALLIIRDFPVFGCGLNAYSIVAPRYKSGLLEAGIYPHNSYLQMAAETGIVGLLSFIFVIVSLFKASITNVRKIKDTFYGCILAGLLTGLFAFLVHSFFDVNFYALQLANLMWFMMGLIIAVQKTALKEEGA